MRLRRVANWGFFVGIALGGVFIAYLWMLYGQLDTAFQHQDQFIPTRIFSDVTHVQIGSLRHSLESRLKSLGYSTQKQASSLSFQLRSPTYPEYLIPDQPQDLAKIYEKPILVNFDSASENAKILSIEWNGKNLTEFYLEPELIATLARELPTEGKGSGIREWVSFEDVPASVWKAIIAIEDQHFMDHRGLDPRGVARAIWVNLKTFSLAQGGSTITQQLVKNLMARRTKNIIRKINEVFLALLLETRFDKEKILERYLNEVYLGQIGSMEVHGVSEGAKHFFGKKLDELNLGEIALMAGLIRGPGFYSPYRYRERALERQHLVLRKMVETGQIAEEEAKMALGQGIRLAAPQTSSNKAPYFSDFVKAELIRQLKDKISEAELTQAGFRVYTTLDPLMSQAAQVAVSNGITELEKKYKIPADDHLEGVLAAVDHETGFIRVLVGGRNYSTSTFNRILNMKRQAGSTFKPLVYLTALSLGEDRRGVPYSPGYPMEDGPWKLIYDRGKQEWSPKNYEKEYRGWISLREALAHSVNTVAARLGYEVGLQNVVKVAQALGVESHLEPLPSLSLGAAEVSPVELLRVYANFANRGVQDELTVIRAITQDDGSAYARFVFHPKQVYDSAPIELLTDMLQSVFKEGTAHDAVRLGFNRPAAGKTGTTSNHRDAWFAGYTPQLTTVVWVGQDVEKTKSTLSLTGATAALPIWVNFMKDAHGGWPVQSFPTSENLSTLLVDLKTGQQAHDDCPSQQTRPEKFLKAHTPNRNTCEMLWPESIKETTDSNLGVK